MRRLLWCLMLVVTTGVAGAGTRQCALAVRDGGVTYTQDIGAAH